MINTIQAFSLSLILLSLSVCIRTGAAAEQPAPVLDMDGKEVRAGVDYYILSVGGRGAAGSGGLTLDSVGNETCPLDVVQERLDVFKGLPAYFRPKKGVVRVSTDHNIIFNASSTCVQSTVWTLAYDESIQRFFVTTGGQEGNPGRETLSNWFKIEEYGSGYKIVFCPTVCDLCRPVCGNVRILVQNSKRRLVLTQNDERPFTFQFQRVGSLDQDI